MGLKRFLFGEDTVSEKADKIVKTKKMTLLDKYLTIKKLYIDYFKYHLEYDAKNSLYELHYEKIYKNVADALTKAIEICRIITVFIGNGLLLRNSRQDQTLILLVEVWLFYVTE